MGIFVAGRSVLLGAQTHLRGLIPGRDYIFQYKAPPFAFLLLSQTEMTALVNGWVKIRPKLDERNSEAVLTIDGMSVNTGTGDILIRGSVAGIPVNSGQEVNPYAVASIIASVFASVQIGVSLLYVYETASGT